jgi:hypothetical protein
MLAYKGLMLAYKGLMLAYKGLMLAYKGLMLAYKGLMLAYKTPRKADQAAACPRPRGTGERRDFLQPGKKNVEIPAERARRPPKAVQAEAWKRPISN